MNFDDESNILNLNSILFIILNTIYRGNSADSVHANTGESVFHKCHRQTKTMTTYDFANKQLTLNVYVHS